MSHVYVSIHLRVWKFGLDENFQQLSKTSATLGSHWALSNDFFEWKVIKLVYHLIHKFTFHTGWSSTVLKKTKSMCCRVTGQTVPRDWCLLAAVLWACYLLAEQQTIAILMVVNSSFTAALSSLYIAVISLVLGSGTLRYELYTQVFVINTVLRSQKSAKKLFWLRIYQFKKRNSL